jgi:hypothetical protein
MKKYRDGIEERTGIPDGIVRKLGIKMEKTKIIVWIGSSEYWTRVYLNKSDNRLYVHVGNGVYELLDTFNIRKVGAAT